jgi:hypothetical protein
MFVGWGRGCDAGSVWHADRVVGRRAVAIGMLAGVLAACGSGTSKAMPIGAALFDGFHVPRGTHLLMPMLPCSELPVDQGGPFCTDIEAAAVLQIDGRPDRVLNEVLAEGRNLGYRGGVRCDNRTTFVDCDGEIHRGRDVAPPTTLDPGTAPTTVDKVPPVDTTTLPPSPGRAVRIRLDYGARVESQGPIAALTLFFAPIRPRGGCETQPPCATSVHDFRVPLRHPRPLVAVGDVIEAAWGPNELKVLPGTRAIARLVGDAGRGDGLTLFTATGDIDALAAQYRHLVATHDFVDRNHDSAQRQDAGWQIDDWRMGGSEGPDVRVSVLRRGREAYIAISVAPYA